MQEFVRTLTPAAIDAVMAALASHAQAGERRDSPAQPNADAGGVSPFSSKYVPPLSLVAYGRRLLKYSYCAPHGILIGVVLLCRYCKTTQHQLTPHTVHRLLLTSVVVALKTHFDVFYSNQYYAQVGGITNPELNRLEVALLDGIHFGATASLEELVAITQRLGGQAKNVPLDKNFAPIGLDRMAPEQAAAVAAAQREIARAACDCAVAPSPFRMDELRARGPSEAAADRAVARGVTIVTTPPVSHAPQRVSQKSVSRAPSMGSGLDSEYIDGAAEHSHVPSRRHSTSTPCA
jgi:hypothetical protein